MSSVLTSADHLGIGSLPDQILVTSSILADISSSITQLGSSADSSELQSRVEREYGDQKDNSALHPPPDNVQNHCVCMGLSDR